MSSALAPLRESNFRWYFAARLVNVAGSMMAPVALAFAVLETSDSASALGSVLAANTIPLVVFLLIGGVIADRFDRALVMRTCNLAAGISQAIAAWLVITGQAEIWHLIVLQAINGTVQAAAFPAMAGVVPQLVPREQLQQANVLLSMSRNALAILGPTASALIVVAVGPGWALAVDASTWLLAALLLTRVRIPARGERERQSPVAELREGWSVFVGTQWLWVIVLAFGFINAIHAGAWMTLGPVIAKDTISEEGWGYALSAEAVGFLLMSLILLRITLDRPLLFGMLGMLAFSAPLFVLGASGPLPLLMAAALIAGMGVELFGLGWNLAMQEHIDEEMLSRAYAYDALGSYVAMPVGMLAYGPLGQAFGFEPVILVSAVVSSAIVVASLLSPEVRGLRRKFQLSTTSP